MASGNNIEAGRLLEQVEAAREFDSELNQALATWVANLKATDGRKVIGVANASDYMTSTDTALKVIAMFRGGRVWDVSKRSQPYFGWGTYRASVRVEDDVNRKDDAIGHGATPALALMSALLRTYVDERGELTIPEGGARTGSAGNARALGDESVGG